MAVVKQTPLAAAIQALRERMGSHDKFAAALRAKDPTLAATRTGLISWEKKVVPSPKYRPALIEMGIDPSLFPAKRSPALQEALEEEVALLQGASVELLRMVILLFGQVTALGGHLPSEMLESSALEVLRKHLEAA